MIATFGTAIFPFEESFILIFTFYQWFAFDVNYNPGNSYSQNCPWSFYDSTDIFKLDSQSLQIKAIPSAQWVAKPKEMLFSSFVAEMNAKGLNVIRPPFGSANLNAYLKLHIDRILIIQKDGKELATITLNYEIFDTKTLKLKKSGTLTQEAQITNKDFAPVFYKVSESVLQSLVDELLVP